MASLIDLLKQRKVMGLDYDYNQNPLSLNYNPQQLLKTNQAAPQQEDAPKKIDMDAINNSNPLRLNENDLATLNAPEDKQETIKAQYLDYLKNPTNEKKGLLASIGQAFKDHPSLAPSLIGAVTALTKGNPYLASAMGQQGANMLQQESQNIANKEKERVDARNQYASSLQESEEKAKQAYQLKGLELATKQSESEEKRQFENEKQQKEFEFKQGQQDKDLAFKEKKQRQDMDMEAKKIAANIQKTQQGKILPAGTATEIGDVVSSVNMLDNLAEKLGDIRGLTYSKADIVKGFNPWDTGAQEFKQLVASTKQVIGKGLEGGVLRAEDEKKYEKIIPAFGDTKEVLQAKYNNLRELLLNKHKNITASLSQSGYNTSNLTKNLGERKIIQKSQQSFNSVAEAEKAKLPKGTIIYIKGRKAVVE